MSAKKAKERLLRDRGRQSLMLEEIDEISVEEQATVSDRWQFQPGTHSRDLNKFWIWLGLALHEANAEQAAAIKAAFPGEWKEAADAEKSLVDVQDRIAKLGRNE